MAYQGRLRPAVGHYPGAWISIYGSRLSNTTRAWTADDFINGKVPTSLDGVSVTINGKNAYINYISPSQINVQAPADTLSGSAPRVVMNSSGSSTVTNVSLQPALPGLFRLTESVVLATDASGGYVSAAKPLDTITLWGTGFGPTNPVVDPGEIFAGSSPLLNSVKIRIGQATAVVPYAGMTGAGVDQFSVVVPALADGDYPVVAEIARHPHPVHRTLAYPKLVAIRPALSYSRRGHNNAKKAPTHSRPANRNHPLRRQESRNLLDRR